MKRYTLKLVSSTAENIFSANFSLKPTCQQKICNLTDFWLPYAFYNIDPFALG